MNSVAQSYTGSKIPNLGQWTNSFVWKCLLHYSEERKSSCKDYKAQVGDYTGDTHHVLVEVVHYHPGQTRVTPVAMHKQQLLEVAESGNGKVTGHDSLGGKNGISVFTNNCHCPQRCSFEDSVLWVCSIQDLNDPLLCSNSS